MAKKRVFVSFDFDNDKTLKDFLVGQARPPDSPFEVIDHSLKEAQPERNWEAKARAAISARHAGAGRPVPLRATGKPRLGPRSRVRMCSS